MSVIQFSGLVSHDEAKRWRRLLASVAWIDYEPRTSHIISTISLNGQTYTSAWKGIHFEKGQAYELTFRNNGTFVATKIPNRHERRRLDSETKPK